MTQTEGTTLTESLRIGVVGTGALGQHHVRLLSEIDRAELVGVFDLRHEVAAEVAGRHGSRVFESLEALVREVEAMVLAVPTIEHARMGESLLDAGLHLLVEKPIAASLDEADALIAAADDRVLAVGHVEFYNPAVQRLLGLGQRPRFVEVERLSIFTPRSLDVDVVLDLMIHDLQILHALDPSPVVEVRATGIDVLSPRVDIANARLELESGCVANITASRVSAEPVRQLRVFLPSHYYSLDYREQTIKGFRLEEGPAAGPRQIVPEGLSVDSREPLRVELEAFIDRCLGGSSEVVLGESGRRALATALEVVDAIA